MAIKKRYTSEQAKLVACELSDEVCVKMTDGHFDHVVEQLKINSVVHEIFDRDGKIGWVDISTNASRLGAGARKASKAICDKVGKDVWFKVVNTR